MKVQVGDATLELVDGDITREETDAIVNAANSGLRGGGGVDGAIHGAGGPSIMEECRKIGGCPTGDAVATTGGKLKAKYVIHAVGPVWKGGTKGEAELLHGAYENSLKRAEEKDLKSVSFPSISTGVYSYPIDQASRIALSTIIDYLKEKSGLKTVRFVLFGASSFEAYKKTLLQLATEGEGVSVVEG
jgi:O-acetyl-ADP-ribose deacetylase (regulator of RNase III)